MLPLRMVPPAIGGTRTRISSPLLRSRRPSSGNGLVRRWRVLTLNYDPRTTRGKGPYAPEHCCCGSWWIFPTPLRPRRPRRQVVRGCSLGCALRASSPAQRCVAVRRCRRWSRRAGALSVRCAVSAVRPSVPCAVSAVRRTSVRRQCPAPSRLAAVSLQMCALSDVRLAGFEPASSRLSGDNPRPAAR